MKWLLLVPVVAVLAQLSTAVQSLERGFCAGGQRWSLCNAHCVRSCENPNPDCTRQCTSGCACPYYRPIWHNNRCISRNQCPQIEQCQNGQVYLRCNAHCVKTCERPNPYCTRQCQPGCGCPPHTPIWQNNRCIRPQQCPGPVTQPPQCQNGQVWLQCSAHCVKTCEVPNPACTRQCQSGCGCPPETPIWHNNRCIKQDQCQACTGGQEWTNCGSACTRTCNTPSNQVCVDICKPRCECPRDRPVWHGGQCIGEGECPASPVTQPPQCRNGQVWLQCSAHCVMTCEVPNRVCTLQCQSGCGCPPETPIWHNNRCIKQDQCQVTPPPRCQNGQVWLQCSAHCVMTCEVPNRVCTLQCQSGCGCPPETPIWHNNRCIKQDQCQACTGGQEWTDCGSACTRNCTTPANQVCFLMCKPRCECPRDRPVWHGGQCIGEGECPASPVTQPPQCQNGQVWVQCSAHCVKTCEVPNPACTRQCESGCGCPPETPIWHNNRCIKQDQCQACTGGQEWTECGSPCTRNCTTPAIQGCILICKRRCQCPPDRPVWHGGQCIGAGECPASPEQCQNGQVYLPCSAHCVKTCERPNPFCSLQCQPGCGCPPHTPIWQNNRCIRRQQCAVTCTGGREWSTCDGNSVGTCSLPHPACPFICQPGCTCPTHAPLWHNGRCVERQRCQVEEQCQNGQVYLPCSAHCVKTCERPNPFCTLQCQPGCGCPPHTPIWQNNRCIRRHQCAVTPSPRCQNGQVWLQCSAHCVKTCEVPNPACTRQCQSGCGCPPETPIWHNDRCIRQDSCQVATSAQCENGRVWVPCTAHCVKTCERPNPMCTLQCQSGCACPEQTPIWHNNRCIRQDQCQVATSAQCENGRVWVPCTAHCVKTCERPNPMCTLQCQSGCACPDQTPIWNNNRCIRQDQCQACTGGQEWTDCGSECTRNCTTPANQVCNMMCKPRCQCPPDRPVWHGGQCIGAGECPASQGNMVTPSAQCQNGQVWLQCSAHCVKTCEVPNPACTKQCQSGCGCPLDTPIWHNDRCIRQDSCQGVRCPGGQEFTSCGSTCVGTCATPIPPCNKLCYRGCRCPSSAPIWENNRCITTDQCPSN